MHFACFDLPIQLQSDPIRLRSLPQSLVVCASELLTIFALYRFDLATKDFDNQMAQITAAARILTFFRVVASNLLRSSPTALLAGSNTRALSKSEDYPR